MPNRLNKTKAKQRVPGGELPLIEVYEADETFTAPDEGVYLIEGERYTLAKGQKPDWVRHEPQHAPEDENQA